MSLSPAMAALAARTAKAWRDEQECSKCGDAHPVTACTYVPTCHYCPALAVITSALGLADDYSEPNELGQREYIAPRPESRCDECHEGFVRAEKRTERLAAEGWV